MDVGTVLGYVMAVIDALGLRPLITAVVVMVIALRFLSEWRHG